MNIFQYLFGDRYVPAPPAAPSAPAVPLQITDPSKIGTAQDQGPLPLPGIPYTKQGTPIDPIQGEPTEGRKDVGAVYASTHPYQEPRTPTGGYTPPAPPGWKKPQETFTKAHPPAPKPVMAPPPPVAAPAGPNYEYYQYENDAGNLVRGTRPKGMTTSMPGDNPAGYAGQGFNRPGSGMTLDQANAFQQLRPAGAPTGAAGTGVKDFFQSMKNNPPPGVHRAPAPPPGSPQSGAPQEAFTSMKGNAGAPYGAMIPEGPGLTVPSNYNETGNPQFGPGVPTNGQPPASGPGGAQAQPNILGYTQQGQPILAGDPQAGLPDFMKGSAFGNFLQMFGMGGG